MFSTMETLNVIETFCNMYVHVDCPKQDNVDCEIPVFIAKKYLFNS